MNGKTKIVLIILALIGFITMGVLLVIKIGDISKASASITCPTGYSLVDGTCYKCTSGTLNSYDKKCYSNANYNAKACPSNTFHNAGKCLLNYGKIYNGHSSTVTRTISECQNKSNYQPTGQKDSSGNFYCYLVVSTAGGYSCSTGTFVKNVKRSSSVSQSGNYCQTNSISIKPNATTPKTTPSPSSGNNSTQKSNSNSSTTTTTTKTSISSCSISLPSKTYNYTGKNIRPEPTVICSGKRLTKGTDYTVSYYNNINAGTATITITGKGNYTGRKAKTFEIVKSSNKTQTPTTSTTPSTTTTYTVTYCNDSKCSIKKTSTATYGQVFNLLAYNTFTKTGYTNTKWAEKKSNGKKTYWTIENINNKKWNKTSNVTLYAVWEPVKYYVYYDGNRAVEQTYNNKKACNKNGKCGLARYDKGSKVKNNIFYSNRSWKYDKEDKLIKNRFKIKGYKFVGWNTQADGSGTSYNDQQAVKNLSSVNGTKITLFAQWEPITYTIRFNANGGIGTMEDQLKTYGVKTKLPTNQFTREGYTFTGWNTKANGSGASFKADSTIGTLSKVDGSIHTLYAQWKKSN